jgi:hypothetical protein
MILVLVVGVDGEKGRKADIFHCGKSIGSSISTLNETEVNKK